MKGKRRGRRVDIIAAMKSLGNKTTNYIHLSLRIIPNRREIQWKDKERFPVTRIYPTIGFNVNGME